MVLMRRWWWLGIALMACDDGDPAPAANDAAPDATRDQMIADAATDMPMLEVDSGIDLGSPGGMGGTGGMGGDPGGMGGAGGAGGMLPPGELLPPEDDCITAVVRMGSLDVFAHEASRLDATTDGQGEDDTRACSRAGVLPWTNLTVVDAEAACVAAGFHLCSDREWQDACGGAERRWPFPYAPNHQPGTCNDHVSGTSVLQPTGSQADCVSPDGVFDMSGNVWEMTADRSRRGASYRVNAVMFRTENARCDIPYVISDAFFGADLGYRCCREAQ